MNRPPLGEKAMTIEELREYAAVEIMGWVRDYEPYYNAKRQQESRPVYKREADAVAVWEWKPDKDRNNLWLVLQTVSENDRVMSVIRRDILRDGFGVCDGSLYYKAMSNPALALEAIVKAHKESK